MKTIKLAEGKYEYDIKDGQMIAARRHGEDWPAGWESRFDNAFMAALTRIVDLEETRHADLAARFDAMSLLHVGDPQARADRAKLAHEAGILGSEEEDARVQARGGNLVVLLDGSAAVLSWGRSRELAELIGMAPLDIQEGDVWALIADPRVQRTIADVATDRVNLAEDRWTDRETMASAWRLVRRGAPVQSVPSSRWAEVEIMGHRRHVGRVSEETLADRKVVRVEALRVDGGFDLYSYGGAAIFSVHDVTEAEARRLVVPREHRACQAFTPSGALPDACGHCGHNLPEHDAEDAERKREERGGDLFDAEADRG